MPSCKSCYHLLILIFIWHLFGEHLVCARACSMYCMCSVCCEHSDRVLASISWLGPCEEECEQANDKKSKNEMQRKCAFVMRFLPKTKIGYLIASVWEGSLD